MSDMCDFMFTVEVHMRAGAEFLLSAISLVDHKISLNP